MRGGLIGTVAQILETKKGI